MSLARRKPRSGRRSAAIEGNRAAASFSAALLGAVLWPIRQNWRTEKRDGFPLSYYPMFSARRTGRLRVTHLVGLCAGGERRLIPYPYAGPGGLNQVRRQIRRLSESDGAEELCRSVAEALVHRGGAEFADVVTVQVVTGEYRVESCFSEAEPGARRERVHSSFEIERPL